ncbi:uncharacterized protein LOC141536075 [Cotesia typhae]|uniref:uncharacterized protein LOC141536075 n=1 Tax=Cotesia typhae TaxID=2053667 RepID=UPI003D6834F1
MLQIQKSHCPIQISAFESPLLLIRHHWNHHLQMMTKKNNRQSRSLKEQEKNESMMKLSVKSYKKKTECLDGKVTSGRNVVNEIEQVFTNDDQMDEQIPFNNEDPPEVLVNETSEERHAELDNMSQTASRSIIPDSDGEDDIIAETRDGHVNANVKIIENNEDGDSDSIALSANNKIHKIF